MLKTDDFKVILFEILVFYTHFVCFTALVEEITNESVVAKSTDCIDRGVGLCESLTDCGYINFKDNNDSAEVFISIVS